LSFDVVFGDRVVNQQSSIQIMNRDTKGLISRMIRNAKQILYGMVGTNEIQIRVVVVVVVVAAAVVLVLVDVVVG
jgi:hypothetical protein